MKIKDVVEVDIGKPVSMFQVGIATGQTSILEKEIGLDAEKIETVIDIWIHENNLGNYDKIPKFKEYQKLAKDISEAELIVEVKK